jgi:hypothetical protein
MCHLLTGVFQFMQPDGTWQQWDAFLQCEIHDDLRRK